MSEGVAETLAAAAAAFAPDARLSEVSLVYGPLVERVNGGPRPELEAAVELVYEGYLAHYRTSRVVAHGAGVQVLLLAGDYFYAHGLRSIAATGDVAAVGLLTRLMGACSALRVEQLPPAIDDGLWEITVSAVASGDGAARSVAAGVFDEVEAASRRQDHAALAAAVERGLPVVRDALSIG